SAHQEPVGLVLRTASRLLLTCTPTKDTRGAPEATGAPLALHYLPAGAGSLVVFINRPIGLLIPPHDFARGAQPPLPADRLYILSVFVDILIRQDLFRHFNLWFVLFRKHHGSFPSE